MNPNPQLGIAYRRPKKVDGQLDTLKVCFRLMGIERFTLGDVRETKGTV